MAAGTLNFAAQIDAWTKQTKARQVAVFRTATELLIDQIVRTTPVDVGFLRASLQVRVNQPLPTVEASLSSTAPPSYSATLAGANIGDYVTAGFAASYAMRLEYGFVGTDSLGRQVNQAPRAWVRGAMVQWPQFVTQAVTQAKAAVKANSGR